MSYGAATDPEADDDFDGEDTLVDIDSPFGEEEACHWDDDANPYEGTYSED